MSRLPKVVLVGGPDVDARLALMDHLSTAFTVATLGSNAALADVFRARGFEYGYYPLDRRVRPIADLRTVRSLTSQLRAMAADVVHTFDTKPGVWGCIAARRAGVPNVVCTVTGLGSLYSAHGMKTAVLRFVYQTLQKAACRRADVTVFQNHDDLRQLVAAGVVDERRTQVILGSGVETNRYSADRVPEGRRAELRRELDLPQDATVVTMISRVTRSKGVLELAAAARSVRRTQPHARFLLIGPDDVGSLDRLRSTQMQQLREVVTWPGPRTDIVDVLAASDVFVLPTAYREGIPRVLLEAASMGLPMITTDSPGCNEAVQHEHNGLLIGAGDVAGLAGAIERLVADADLRQRFGACSRQRALSLFDLSVVAAQTRALYEGLLSRAGPTADRR